MRRPILLVALLAAVLAVGCARPTPAPPTATPAPSATATPAFDPDSPQGAILYFAEVYDEISLMKKRHQRRVEMMDEPKLRDAAWCETMERSNAQIRDARDHCAAVIVPTRAAATHRLVTEAMALFAESADLADTAINKKDLNKLLQALARELQAATKLEESEVSMETYLRGEGLMEWIATSTPTSTALPSDTPIPAETPVPTGTPQIVVLNHDWPGQSPANEPPAPDSPVGIYVGRVFTALIAITDAHTERAALLDERDLGSAYWAGLVQEQNDIMREGHEVIESLTVPDEATETQKAILAGTTLLVKGAEHLELAVRYKDTKAWQQFIETDQQASAKMIEAWEKLEDLAPPPEKGDPYADLPAASQKYLALAIVKSEAMENALLTLSDMFQNPQHGDATWLTEVREEADTIRAAYADLVDLEPPDDLAPLHEALVYATGILDEVADLIEASAVEPSEARNDQIREKLVHYQVAEVAVGRRLASYLAQFEAPPGPEPDEPMPTSEPATTMGDVSDLSYAALQAQCDAMTDEQWQPYAESLKGAVVSWSGWVINRRPAGNQDVLWVDMEEPGTHSSPQECYVPVPSGNDIEMGAKITWVGEIKGVVAFLGKVAVWFESAEIVE